MNFNDVFNKIHEQVIINRDNTYIFSMPNQIDSDEAKELANAITQDKSGTLKVLSDQITHKKIKDKDGNEVTIELNANEIWNWLETTQIGQDLLKKYPNIKNYRVSSEKISILDDPNFFEIYDAWANKSERNLGTSMPSFREFSNNPNKWRQNQTSGSSTKSPSF